MTEITKLAPEIVWRQFDAITRIPRPSKKEGRMIEYLVAFAREHGLPCMQDAAGNVVIRKGATKGMENRPTVTLQSHMDMVCEKRGDVAFDFEQDPIRAYVDDGWVKAEGTTLGADDGIGMAAALALLASGEIAHGPLEALFTVDEETGLTGAFNLGEEMISGRYLVNLDSEDEGEIFIGCAGGIDTVAVFPCGQEPLPAGYVVFRVELSGLKGGHSGDNIGDGLGNSNRLLARLVWLGMEEYALRLARFEGGNLRNAIPREAHALLAIPREREAEFRQAFERFRQEIEAEYAETEPTLRLTLAPAEADRVLTSASARSLIYALVGLPNGVLAMSHAVPGLVETSSNLASVKFEEGNIVVTTSQRSSVESAKKAAARAVESVFALAGARVSHSDGYPGWTPNPHSHLLEVTTTCYRDLFGTEPKVRAIHAGLECGLFLERHPELEMVSFGPTLRGVHSPDERLEIATVDRFWRLLVAVVQSL